MEENILSSVYCAKMYGYFKEWYKSLKIRKRRGKGEEAHNLEKVWPHFKSSYNEDFENIYKLYREESKALNPSVAKDVIGDVLKQCVCISDMKQPIFKSWRSVEEWITTELSAFHPLFIGHNMEEKLGILIERCAELDEALKTLRNILKSERKEWVDRLGDGKTQLKDKLKEIEEMQSCENMENILLSKDILELNKILSGEQVDRQEQVET